MRSSVPSLKVVLSGCRAVTKIVNKTAYNEKNMVNFIVALPEKEILGGD